MIRQSSLKTFDTGHNECPDRNTHTILNFSEATNVDKIVYAQGQMYVHVSVFSVLYLRIFLETHVFAVCLEDLLYSSYLVYRCVCVWGGGTVL